MIIFIRPAPKLVELRKQVLDRSQKRMPKWKFRLASDLVLQLQPKPPKTITRVKPDANEKCERYQVTRLFEGKVAIAENANAQLFDPYSKIPHESYLLGELKICELANGDWDVSVFGVRSKKIIARTDTLADRIATAFNEGRFDQLNAAMMLGHWCLICGKGLTDPASMARWIGPECANTSSIVVPRTFNLFKEGAA